MRQSIGLFVGGHTSIALTIIHQTCTDIAHPHKLFTQILEHLSLTRNAGKPEPILPPLSYL